MLKYDYKHLLGGIVVKNVTMQLLTVFVISGILKCIFLSSFASIFIDLAVLGAIYILLRRQYPYYSIKKIMLYISGMTVVSILVDIGILRADIGNLIILAILGWMFFGGGNIIGGYRRR